MTVVACGINHRVLSIADRERLIAQQPNHAELLADILALTGVKEAVILSTCHRIEIYVVAESSQIVVDWFYACALRAAVTLGDVYRYEDLAAIRHLLRVSCGLDAILLGEPQILGQFKRAYTDSLAAGGVGSVFRCLFPELFASTKLIRQQAELGRYAVTMGYAIQALVKRVFGSLSGRRVVCLGAGEVTLSLLSYFLQSDVADLCVLNRTPVLPEALGVSGVRTGSLADLSSSMLAADVVVAATSAGSCLIDVSMMQALFRSRRHAPLLMVDLSVPRNIDAKVADLADVYLYHLDDLEQILADNRRKRQAQARVAEQHIAVAADRALRRLRMTAHGQVIAEYRQWAYDVRDQALRRAQLQLTRGESAAGVLDELARGLTNQLLHRPTLELREALVRDREEHLTYIVDLYEKETA